MPSSRDLLFWIPKMLDFFEQPLDWVLALLLIAVILFWRRHTRAGVRVVLAATSLLAAIGLVAIPDVILQRLENEFRPTARATGEFEGLIVLGGGLDGGQTAEERGQTLLGSSAERATTALAIARRAPQLKIVVTGYAGLDEPDHLSEAAATVRFFEEQGLPTSGVIVEPTARNTSEIAENVKRLGGIDPARPWLLVTSAWNMPRALLTFKKAGWNVEPMPVDYVTGTSLDYFQFSLHRGAARWNMALHELLGILWYRLTGRL